jgi:hypothetical protein
MIAQAIEGVVPSSMNTTDSNQTSPLPISFSESTISHNDDKINIATTLALLVGLVQVIDHDSTAMSPCSFISSSYFSRFYGWAF